MITKKDKIKTLKKCYKLWDKIVRTSLSSDVPITENIRFIHDKGEYYIFDNVDKLHKLSNAKRIKHLCDVCAKMLDEGLMFKYTNGRVTTSFSVLNNKLRIHKKYKVANN